MREPSGALGCSRDPKNRPRRRARGPGPALHSTHPCRSPAPGSRPTGGWEGRAYLAQHSREGRYREAERPREEGEHGELLGEVLQVQSRRGRHTWGLCLPRAWQTPPAWPPADRAEPVPSPTETRPGKSLLRPRVGASLCPARSGLCRPREPSWAASLERQGRLWLFPISHPGA